MSGVTGRAAGYIAKLYMSSSVITTKSYANLLAGCDANTEVLDVSDMGALTKSRNIIDVPVYGEDVMSKLPGQADPGTFDFTVSMNFDDPLHQSIRDDDSFTNHTFIIKFTQGANITLAGFDGRIANAEVSQPIDNVIQMAVSVARDGGVTYADAV